MTPQIAFPPPILVYPVPGATGVPDSITDIVFAGQVDSTVSPAFLLQMGTQPPIALGSPTTAPSPLPSPLASYPPGLPLAAVPLPRLSAATEYALVYRQLVSYGGCPPPKPQVSDTDLGSFETK